MVQAFNKKELVMSSFKYMSEREEDGERVLVIFNEEPQELDFKKFKEEEYFESNSQLDFGSFSIRNYDRGIFRVFREQDGDETQIFRGVWRALLVKFRKQREGFDI